VVSFKSGVKKNVFWGTGNIEGGLYTKYILDVFTVLRSMDTSPEIKRLVDKLSPLTGPSTNQAKYEAILQRKSYDHHCFLECVRLRLDRDRGVHAVCSVQENAYNTFAHMLSHTYHTK
jgi:hypothetical protein